MLAEAATFAIVAWGMLVLVSGLAAVSVMDAAQKRKRVEDGVGVERGGRG